MRITDAPLIARLARPPSRPQLNIVLAYEDFSSALRARKFFETLAREHDTLFQFNCHLWKFGVLRDPHLFEVATRDVAEADMIVLALRRSDALSDDVRRCLDHWLSSGSAESRALVALLECPSGSMGGATTMAATLRQLAERANLAFLCKEIELPAMDSQFPTQNTRASLRKESRQPAPMSNSYVGQPRWGLNEY